MNIFLTLNVDTRGSYSDDDDDEEGCCISLLHLLLMYASYDIFSFINHLEPVHIHLAAYLYSDFHSSNAVMLF